MTSSAENFLSQDRLATAMHRCGHAWRLAINEALQPLKLTHLQWAIVQLVKDLPGRRQTELAESIGIEGPSLVRVLDGLERDGWVERRPCPDDRRAKRVYVREDAAGRISEAFVAIQTTHEKAVSGLSLEQRQQMVYLVESMSDRLLGAAGETPKAG
jgi:MarR family transcriptional regulator for hemolysin